MNSPQFYRRRFGWLCSSCICITSTDRRCLNTTCIHYTPGRFMRLNKP